MTLCVVASRFWFHVVRASTFVGALLLVLRVLYFEFSTASRISFTDIGSRKFITLIKIILN